VYLGPVNTTGEYFVSSVYGNHRREGQFVVPVVFINLVSSG